MNSREKINSSKTQSKTRRELDDDFSEALAVADAATAKAAKAQAKAAKAEAEAERAMAEAERATEEVIRKGEALKERIRAEKVHTDAPAANAHFGGHDCSIHSRTRELLVKALGMLGSDQVGERAAAALLAEKQRIKLGMTWNELIVREDDDDEDLDEDDEDLDDDELDDDDLDDEEDPVV